ncbi:MAG: hypothetical protein ACYCXY_12805 [Acidimicrobiales bacterium]
MAYQHPDFSGWNTMASRSDHFTGPEIDEAVTRLRAEEKLLRGERVAAVMQCDNTHGERRALPRLAVLTVDTHGAEVGADHPLTGQHSEPRIHDVVRLVRTSGRVVELRRDWGDRYPAAGWPCWDSEPNTWAKAWRRVFLDEALVQVVTQAREHYQAVHRLAGELDDVVRAHEERVCGQWNAREERRALRGVRREVRRS